MATRGDREVAWCVFRNLVHAVYREARHLGPPGDHTAKLVVSDGAFASAAARCRVSRAVLKTTQLYQRTANAPSTEAVLRPGRARARQ